MQLRFVAPVVGIALLAGCGGNSESGGPGHNAPVIPSVAAAKSLDDADQAFMTEHFNKAMESAITGQTKSWTNPSSGAVVRVSPTRTFQQENSTYCREFTQAIGDKDPAVRGTACRQSDGNWQIVS
jgi:surface antigen